MCDKKKRGVSKCKKKLLHPDAFTVDLDEKGNAIGMNATRFLSWIGVEFKRRIPYTKVAKKYLKEKQLRDEGSYPTKDVVMEMLGKGRKHTGPTHCRFSEQKTKKKKGEAVETTAGRSLVFVAWAMCPTVRTTGNLGRVHPTHERVVHGCPMVDGFVKVQILNKDSPQIVEPSHHFEATFTHQQQTIPHERNKYQIYSYTLQDEEAFSQLLAGKEFSQNTTEHTSFYEPTKPVNVNQPTEHVHAYQHTKSVNGCMRNIFKRLLNLNRYLYAARGREGIDNTEYFHPRYIEGELVLDDGDFVIDRLRQVISFHKDQQVYGTVFSPCRRQPNGWECGYCVMMAMYDFVIYNGEHMLVDKTAMVRQGEINEFVERTLKRRGILASQCSRDLVVIVVDKEGRTKSRRLIDACYLS
ncbi:hypothetical protein M8C21_016717 [Ambrosia artemisiifolia]|uniref:Uncharacterized protein n=1 Tax=Ambrosia artemisiifolia TaxID=4212 RepID=A0AAD5CW95_AMBAR|nr:hypothetical protein M8C21_016717 [Ambrosia artemisiifolia]